MISLNTMYVGETGTGKTHNMCTYPKLAIISTEPNHHWVWELNPELKKNVVAQEYFIPEQANFKGMFDRISNKIKEYKAMAEKGEVETLGIDNFTYLMDYRWMWINEFQQIASPRTGELDTRSMYGSLKLWATRFLVMDIINFKGNVVLNTHEMLEYDEALEKKVDKSITHVPNITGGLRDEIGGYFSNIFFLSKIETKDGYRYVARTNKGAGKNAKNRFGLPPIIEDVSYAKIMEIINKVVK